MKLLILISFLFITSCTSLETVQELNPKIYYKPDIKLTVDGKVYHGWGMLPPKSPLVYKLEIEAPGQIDLLKISTCARFDTDEPEGGIIRNVFGNTKRYTYSFIPIPKDELSETCPIMIEAYEAGIPGRHSFGIFEIDDGGKYSGDTLPAIVTCNAKIEFTKGSSICVHLDGLTQRISFDVPVMLMQDSLSEKCRIPTPDSGRIWEFNTPNRECVYYFKEVGGNGRFHKHSSIGFEEIAVRRYK